MQYFVKYEFVIEWSATILVIAGSALTSMDIYPLNLAVAMIGNLGWLVVGVLWRKWSLIIIQTVLSAIYAVGLVTNHIH
jgi:hypothetical protein